MDEQEVFDILRNINDPEHPLTLEQLNVVFSTAVRIHWTLWSHSRRCVGWGNAHRATSLDGKIVHNHYLDGSDFLICHIGFHRQHKGGQSEFSSGSNLHSDNPSLQVLTL